MVAPTRPPKNGFNAAARKVYNPLGFSKAYNFILWFIFAGALFGFCLARFMYLNFNGIFCSAVEGPNHASPGECYFYLNFTQYKVGILLHLAGILPAGILAVLQFTPFIRHKWIIIHRICGYAAILFTTISIVGAWMIARHAFGGGVDVQAWVYLVGFLILGCFVLAYINIKRLQIEQHRAWMLRAWFYAGSIITNRLIIFIASTIISNSMNYYTTWPCSKIAFTLKSESRTLEDYPTCTSYFDGSNLGKEALVHANMNGKSAVEVGAALNVCFGMALWVATALHAIGVEVYLRLTPKEAERLRKVSYQRQLEAGMHKPGSAGLTADKLGDAEPWVHQSRKESDSTLNGDPSVVGRREKHNREDGA